jgi:hypothetical protein
MYSFDESKSRLSRSSVVSGCRVVDRNFLFLRSIGRKSSQKTHHFPSVFHQFPKLMSSNDSTFSESIGTILDDDVCEDYSDVSDMKDDENDEGMDENS